MSQLRLIPSGTPAPRAARTSAEEVMAMRARTPHSSVLRARMRRAASCSGAPARCRAQKSVARPPAEEPTTVAPKPRATTRETFQ
jgi:hypothetical protein